jgi:hypothetical protein
VAEPEPLSLMPGPPRHAVQMRPDDDDVVRIVGRTISRLKDYTTSYTENYFTNAATSARV